MEKTKCEKCKHYYMWQEQYVSATGGKPIYKTFASDYCSKANRGIDKIAKCNGFEEGGKEEC